MTWRCLNICFGTRSVSDYACAHVYVSRDAPLRLPASVQAAFSDVRKANAKAEEKAQEAEKLKKSVKSSGQGSQHNRSGNDYGGHLHGGD